MHKITPCLWFDDQAEPAARFYVSLFPRSRVLETLCYDEAASQASGKPAGSVLTVTFELEGQRFVALNGGPQFPFTEAISLMVDCQTQDEVDELWDKLTADGGEEGPCGWLKDKYGLSWQIVPTVLNATLQDPDTAKASRAMRALIQMKKLDIAALQRAFHGD